METREGVVLILHLGRRQRSPAGLGAEFWDILLLSPGGPGVVPGVPRLHTAPAAPSGAPGGAESLMSPDGLLDKSQSAAFLELAGLPSQDSSAGGDGPRLAWLAWGFRGHDPFASPGDFQADSISFVCEFLPQGGEWGAGGIESRLPSLSLCSQYLEGFRP